MYWAEGHHAQRKPLRIYTGVLHSQEQRINYFMTNDMLRGHSRECLDKAPVLIGEK
jgi:hypothetical protein